MTDHWMQTRSGAVFCHLRPRPEDIHIDDIASSLAKICRYLGHCRGFYSVAEHCILLSRHVPAEMALEALLHDAAEAYMGDIVRPVKRMPDLYPLIRPMERRIMAAVAERFALTWPLPDEIARADLAILHDERSQVMAPCAVDWFLPEPALGVCIAGLEWRDARQAFLDRFFELLKVRPHRNATIPPVCRTCGNDQRENLRTPCAPA